MLIDQEAIIAICTWCREQLAECCCHGRDEDDPRAWEDQSIIMTDDR